MKVVAFFILLLYVSSCDTTTVEKPKIELADKPKNIFGLYSYALHVHSSHCEGVKHLIRLNQDSTFILKAYCLSGSSSDFHQENPEDGPGKKILFISLFVPMGQHLTPQFCLRKKLELFVLKATTSKTTHLRRTQPQTKGTGKAEELK